MKIVQVLFYLTPGGAERMVVDLSNELSKDNEVVLLTLIDDQVEPERRQFYKYDLSERVIYKNLGIPLGGGFKFWPLWKVYKAIKDENADVIHLHTAHIVNFCILAICFLCWNTKIIQTIHTDFKVGHTSRVYKFLFTFLGRLHKMSWVALSEPNYKDMMTTYPFINGARIDNGRAPVLPTPLFDNVKSEIDSYRVNEDTKIFLHVARCVEVKNQMMLVSAFNKFAETANAKLLIIGADFDSELGQKIQKGAGEHVHFLGTRKNIADYMLNSDVFCLSSIYEGLPITLLEALLSGTPIVCTPIAASHDVLTNGKNAIVSTDFSEAAYVYSLREVTNKLPELAQYCAETKDCNPYTMKECANKYMAFYRRGFQETV